MGPLLLSFTLGEKKTKAIWNLQKPRPTFELIKNTFKNCIRSLSFEGHFEKKKIHLKDFYGPCLSGCLLPFQNFEFHRKLWPNLTLLYSLGKTDLVLFAVLQIKLFCVRCGAEDTISFLPVWAGQNKGLKYFIYQMLLCCYLFSFTYWKFIFKYFLENPGSDASTLIFIFNINSPELLRCLAVIIPDL